MIVGGRSGAHPSLRIIGERFDHLHGTAIGKPVIANGFFHLSVRGMIRGALSIICKPLERPRRPMYVFIDARGPFRSIEREGEIEYIIGNLASQQMPSRVIDRVRDLVTFGVGLADQQTPTVVFEHSLLPACACNTIRADLEQSLLAVIEILR